MSKSIIEQFKNNDYNADNRIYVKMEAKPQNEKLARNLIASFLLDLNPTVEELSDIKTVISEAVTNCIVHGYNKRSGEIVMEATIKDKDFCLSIADFGVGITDIKKAMQPFFTTKPEEERSGMGFTVMETFMDDVVVENNQPKGTIVYLSKTIKSGENAGV